jgi:hypothetical protein
MIEVLMFGAEKYDDHNWKKGLEWVGITESLQRHLNAFIDGEDDDPESKLTHVGHILCNAMFLSYMFLFRKDLDNRYIDPNFNIDQKLDAEQIEALSINEKQKGVIL